MSRPMRVAHVTTVDLTLRYMLLPQLRALREAGFEVTTISAPGPDVAAIEAEGFRHIAWPGATRGWNLREDLRAFGSLRRILRAERFDLVHTHNPKPGVMGRVAARLAGVPCVVNTVHGLYATPEDRPARRLPILALERVAAACSDAELYQSEEDFAWARRIHLARRRRMRLLGNGIDLARFAPGAVTPERRAALRAALGLPAAALVVGTVGRLVAEKGYRELFDAARRVRAEEPGVAFLAIGAVDHEKWDAVGADEVARAREDVVLPGWRVDVRDLLAVMDVFVLASWREGLPRSAIEAAATGLPLVLTNIRGCREVARDGVEGLLVPPRDTDALAGAILRLARDADLRARLGAAARGRACDRFDERTVAATVIDEYRRVAARRGLAAPAASGVRAARRDDAAAMARLHRDMLPRGFLPRLGTPFLRVLYRALVDDPAGAAVVAERDGAVVGFAAGVASVPAFYRRFFRRHGIAAALAVNVRALRPGVLRRARETARYPAASKDLPAAELLAWAVAPLARGEGLGKTMSARIVEQLGARGAGEVKIVVSAGLPEANELLAATGWARRASISLHDGRPSNVWVIRCRSSSPSRSRSS